MSLISRGEKILSRFDLAKHFRSFQLGSDYKDKIFERISTSFEKWVKSESFRYKLYWNEKEKNRVIPEEEKFIFFEKYSFLKKIQKEIYQKTYFYSLVKRLSRKQILVGKPKHRKKCSLAFAIRANRQSTIKISQNKLSLLVPKLKGMLGGKFNFLPTCSDYQFKLATLKKDLCGTLWLKLTYEQNVVNLNPPMNEDKNKILVGIDMGLKTTRTVVAVNEVSKEIIETYQPERTRYFDKAYQALVNASTKNKRALPFVHRKIARRRLDNICKDIVKIISMGDVFKFGKPSSAFLFSGRLARSAADAANSLFLTRFAKRAELAAKESGEVNESYTSVTCRRCGSKKQMPLKLRIYECKNCDHIEDRDVNSGYQIAFRNFLDIKEAFV